MHEMNEQFENQLRRDLRRLADEVSADDLDAKLIHRLRRRTIYRRVMVSSAAAAVLVAAILLVHVLGGGSRIQHASLTPAQIDAQIDRIGISTKLLLSAQVLTQAPGGEELARENLEYIVKRYPETKAAVEAKAQLQILLNRRIMQ